MALAPTMPGRPWTAEDLADAPENARYEVLDGSLLVSPLERETNVWAAIRLAQQLRPQLEGDWHAEREIGVRLGSDALIPDVVVLRPPPEPILRAQLGIDAADVALVVEVVSPTSRKRDRFLKPAAYAEAGIPAFWRVELDPEPRLFAYALTDEDYGLVAEISGKGTVPLLEGTVTVDVVALCP